MVIYQLMNFKQSSLRMTSARTVINSISSLLFGNKKVKPAREGEVCPS